MESRLQGCISEHLGCFCNLSAKKILVYLVQNDERFYQDLGKCFIPSAVTVEFHFFQSPYFHSLQDVTVHQL